MIRCTTKLDNIITIASLPANLTYRHEVKEKISTGHRLQDIDMLNIVGRYKNLVMDDIKEAACEYLWDQAVKMMITTQVNDPVGTESTPTTGIIYIATENQLLNKIQGNPYYLTWGIYDIDDDGRSADGFWGSLLLLKADDYRMNRVQVLTTKPPDTEMFIEYELQQL